VTYTITVPDVPPSLNKVLRMHWRVKNKLRHSFETPIYYLLGKPAIGELRQLVFAQQKMRVVVTIHNARQYDKDNAYGACKVIFDVIKKLGLIVDDRPEFLESEVRQAKSTRKRKRTVIEIGPAEAT
jgi:hypothetical protein